MGEDVFASSKEWSLSAVFPYALLSHKDDVAGGYFWLTMGADVLLKFKCFWALIPRFTELIREKTFNDFSYLSESVCNKVAAGRM